MTMLLHEHRILWTPSHLKRYGFKVWRHEFSFVELLDGLCQPAEQRLVKASDVEHRLLERWQRLLPNAYEHYYYG